MMALLGSLLGLLGSALPEFFKATQAKRDAAHELAMFKLQCEHAEKLQAGKLQELTLSASVEEAKILHQPLPSVGIAFVDALAGSVRPVLTYLFFMTYVAVKAAQYDMLLNPTLPWQTPMSAAQALLALWGEEDQAIFAAIMSFWFGQRALLKARVR